MATEKMMILKMLEEGKINAEEAARLLATTDGGSVSSSSASSAVPRNFGSQTPSSPGPSVHRPASGPSGPSDGTGPRPNAPLPGKTVGSAVDDMGRKFGAFVKEAEPKVRKFAETVVEKTASAADSLSKSLQSHGDKRSVGGGSASYFPAAPTMSARPSKPSGPGVEEMIEIRVASFGGELNLTGLNGQVQVKGYNGDKISAKIFTVAKRAGAKAELAALGNKYYLSFDENDFERVCIDAFVPEAMFDSIKAATTNGDISLSTVTAVNVQVENMNGATEIAGIKAQNLIIESNNGGLRLLDTAAEMAKVENFNGPITISKVDISNLKSTTFNGAIDMQIAGFSAYDYYNWHVETSNAKLSLVLPSYSTLGYYVKGHAALDNVKLGLVGMNYMRNDRSFVEAKSINYDTAHKKVDLTLTTSNAPLVVN